MSVPGRSGRIPEGPSTTGETPPLTWLSAAMIVPAGQRFRVFSIYGYAQRILPIDALLRQVKDAGPDDGQPVKFVIVSLVIERETQKRR